MKGKECIQYYTWTQIKAKDQCLHTSQSQQNVSTPHSHSRSFNNEHSSYMWAFCLL